MRFASHQVRMRKVSWNGLVAGLMSVLLSTLSTAPSTTQAAERPTWQALPDETVALVRVPNLKEVYEAFRTRTKLGAMAFEEKRVDTIKELILEESKADLEEISAELVKVGLSFDDLLGSFGGEIGYAATIAKLEGKPAFVGLVWAECGATNAEKWIAALDRFLELQSDGIEKIAREDIELAGTKVRRLRVPLTGPKSGNASFQFKANSKTGLKVDANVKPKDEPDAEREVVHAYVQVLIGRHEGKLLAAHTIASDVDTTADTAEKPADGKAELALREHATATFARFLEAQSGDGEGIVQRKMQTPGLAEALPEGVPIVEFLFDVPSALNMLDLSDTSEQGKLVRALALEQLGPLAYRATLDGTALRSGLFLSAASPRKGLPKLLDQPSLPPKPADWVSTDVVGYQHWSIDLGGAYKLISDIVRRQTPKGEESIAAIEEQAKQFLQTDPVTLLSSLGTKHTIVTFLPEKKEAGAPAEEETSQNAMAFVWRLTDEALWKRLLQLAATVAVKEVGEERGYAGLRHDSDGFHGGWFIGDGTMVVAIGKGVTEKALSMLRTPPQAGASLAGSPIATRAAELIPPQDAITYDLTNGPTLLKFFNQTIVTAMETSEEPTTKKLKPVWPSDKEWEGSIGVSVSVTTVNEAGLTHRSVSDLPPP
ncbi:MAG: hypothetical protein K8U03_08080 [Planctomycetia bacterium]|nr:hypothetical protein [Planctomycetia bacterium]